MTSLLPIALGLLLQSTTLLLLGLVAMRLAQRRGPAVQSLLGRATLAGVGLALLLAAPLTGHIRPIWIVKVTSGPPSPTFRGAIFGHGGALLAAPSAPSAAPTSFPSRFSLTPPELGDGGRSLLPSKLSPAPVVSPPLRPQTRRFTPALRPSSLPLLYAAITAAWAFGTALLIFWLAVCQWHLSRLRRQARAITTGPAADTLAALTPRPPALLIHPSVRSPFLAGIRHPAIFLPTTYETASDPTALRAILAHELAHLDRRDIAWTLAARLLCALLWPQPLLWVLCRHLEQISEEACDQAVLAQHCPPRAYADCLLTLAAHHPLGRRERALGAGVAPFRSSLGRRISRILDKGTHAMSTVTPRLRLAIAALAVAAAFGSAFLVSSAPAQSPGIAPVTLTPEQQRFNAMRLQDMANLKAIGIALTQCVQDHDEFYPHAAHWMDDLSPYLKDKAVLFDPFQPGARRYGYALNRNCSGKSLAAFAHPWETIAVFDSTLGTRNASDMGQSLRVTIAGNMSGGSYLFVDGHVKWNRTADRPSFAVQWDPRWHDNPPPGYYSRRSGTRSLHPTLMQLLGQQNARAPFVVQNDALGQTRFLAGLTPVQGPGVVVTLNDSKKALSRKLPPGMTPPNIIHDSDINAVINELKAAGAEAIAVNDQRLVAISPVRVSGPTIIVNNTLLTPPFLISAIGDPRTLTAALNVPGGITDQINRFDPTMFSVRAGDMLTLPAYSGGSEPRYAKPVLSSSPEAVQQGVLGAGSQSLAQQRKRLQEQLVASDAEAAALTAQMQRMQVQIQQAVKKLPDYDSSTRGLSQIRRQTLTNQIA